jgi:hypothetical protein
MVLEMSKEQTDIEKAFHYLTETIHRRDEELKLWKERCFNVEHQSITKPGEARDHLKTWHLTTIWAADAIKDEELIELHRTFHERIDCVHRLTVHKGPNVAWQGSGLLAVSARGSKK